MNPSRRARLREDLRADTARFAALAERHGTPLLVLQPYLVARRYGEMAARLPGFHVHYAVAVLLGFLHRERYPRRLATALVGCTP
jgi:ornithine decarboxylase